MPQGRRKPELTSEGSKFLILNRKKNEKYRNSQLYNPLFK
ncbi:hypothetical protein HOLDEFILI_04135 [Holdemania filiformis DSM 12042]|uniref:Uncharacterized protein n=1 Tax=Holdemania filiformis DSM 12042 TaxID=545696 RepID=B9YE61_9FIRM|nr:hypothetical protein HOLDEFILI_04135 [Holdemania filiformis DSM 12042]